jgi:hypothetical protein
MNTIKVKYVNIQNQHFCEVCTSLTSNSNGKFNLILTLDSLNHVAEDVMSYQLLAQHQLIAIATNAKFVKVCFSMWIVIAHGFHGYLRGRI